MTTQALPQHPEHFESTNVDDILKALGGEPDESEIDPSEEEIEEDEGASSGVQEEKTAPAEQAAAQAVKQEEVEQEVKPGEAEAQDQKTVPLSAVFAEREKARRAREHAAQLEARIAELEKASAEGKQAPAAEIEGLSDQDIAELEEDLPHLAKGIKAIRDRLSTLESENKDLRTRETGRERVAQEDAQEDARNVVSEAISANAKLAHLEKTLSPDAWDARVFAIDDTLRTDPEFGKLSLEDRFNKVVEIYEYRYGPVSLPTQATTPPKEDIVKVAAEKVSQAAAQAPAPHTLSDMPGGVPPQRPEQEFQQMTPQQLEKRLMELPMDDWGKVLDKFA